MKTENIKLETYGKQNRARRTYLEVKDRFSINPNAKKILDSIGLKPYIHK